MNIYMSHAYICTCIPQTVLKILRTRNVPVLYMYMSLYIYAVNAVVLWCVTSIWTFHSFVNSLILHCNYHVDLCADGILK